MARYIYSVLRFVPNVASGEFVNIGAVAGCDVLSDWAVRTVSSHTRAKKLDDRHLLAKVFEHIGTIEDLCGSSDGTDTDDGDAAVILMNETMLQKVRSDWQNMVQLSEPTPIVADSADGALDAVFAQQIIDPGRKGRPYRTRKQAVAAVWDAYEAANLVGILRSPSVRPPRHPVNFDFAVANGKALQLVQTWSFEIPSASDLARDVRSWGWGVQELKDKGAMMTTEEESGKKVLVPANVDIQVVYIPPMTGGPGERAWEEAQAVFEEISLKPVDLSNVKNVADKAKSLLAATVT